MKLLPILTMVCATSLMAQSYFIKGPETPKPYELTAIKELTDYLAKRINGKLTIGGKSPITFQVGDTELAKQHKLLSDALPEEEWHIKSVGDQIILNGGGSRGALYATYHFLEDHCGIHWWSVVEDYVPAASSLTLPALDESGKPVLIYRDMYVSQAGPNHPQLRARVRLNGCDGTHAKPEFGGSFEYGLPARCHTFDRYFPAKEYLATHPEYFSLRKGKRVGGQGSGQLCITNKEMRKECLKKLMAYIKQSYDEAKAKNVPPPKVFDLSMNDNHGKCECDNCKAEEEKYNTSGLYVMFLNELAAEVAKVYPDAYLSTLAYFYNEPPPKGGVKAADNVIIQLCDTKTNQAGSILEPSNKIYHDFLSQWKNHAKHIFIWDYAIVFGNGMTGLPFASEWHYGDLFRTYHENNVSGVFWEHENPHMGDMYELKFFVEAKLMENPYLDDKQLIKTFMECFYGPAAPFITEYRRKLDDVRKQRNGDVKWFPSLASFNFISDDDIIEFEAIFDKAEAAVKGDDKLFRHVRQARCGLDRLLCMRKGRGGFYHGPALAQDSKFNVKAAGTRLAESWPAWARQFPNGKKLEKDVSDIIAQYSAARGMLPPPEEFKDRNYYDFYPEGFVNYSQVNKLLDEPSSPVGKAIEVQSETSKHYELPFAVGYYDQGHKKTLSNVTHKTPLKKGYAWYSGGKVRIPEDGYIFVTRSWNVSQRTGAIGSLVGKEFEIYVSAKFIGPMYWKDEQGPSHIYVDRMLLVEPSKQ